MADRDKKLPLHITSTENYQRKNRQKRVRYLSNAALCLVLAATATVFECFALFNIQFCDGEDLMSLYWGFWSVLQLGSNIAILGVIVHFWIVLGDFETPSWAVACEWAIISSFCSLSSFYPFLVVASDFWRSFTFFFLKTSISSSMANHY
jgi:hypothetical protein